MNKKREQKNNLLYQFYNKLNISWQDRPESGNKNPVLHKVDNSLMSKSIAHKFYSSKRYKLKEGKQTVKKQSAHVFTTFGIINVSSHKRRMSQPSMSKPEDDNNYSKNDYLMSSCTWNQNFIGKKSLKNNFIEFNDQIQCEAHSKQQKFKPLKNHSLRSASAHLNTKRSKNSSFEHFSHRRLSSGDWQKKPKKEAHSQQVKGWEFQPDCTDLHLIYTRSHTQN